jgi:hypothetical protein
MEDQMRTLLTSVLLSLAVFSAGCSHMGHHGKACACGKTADEKCACGKASGECKGECSTEEAKK